MASGQQRAQQNIDAFMQWQATQSNDDFKQITLKGQLNRTEIAKAVGCGKSALLQNPALRNALRLLEDSLREKGVLPPLTAAGPKAVAGPKLYDNTAHHRALESKRLICCPSFPPAPAYLTANIKICAFILYQTYASPNFHHN